MPNRVDRGSWPAPVWPGSVPRGRTRSLRPPEARRAVHPRRPNRRPTHLRSPRSRARPQPHIVQGERLRLTWLPVRSIGILETPQPPRCGAFPRAGLDQPRLHAQPQLLETADQCRVVVVLQIMPVGLAPGGQALFQGGPLSGLLGIQRRERGAGKFQDSLFVGAGTRRIGGWYDSYRILTRPSLAGQVQAGAEGPPFGRKSVAARSSNISDCPGLVRTSNDMKVRRSCQPPRQLSPSTELGLWRHCDQGPERWPLK